MKQFFPSITIKCCRFHFWQVWWRKIQKIGLSSEYKEAVRNGKMDERTFWYSFPEQRWSSRLFRGGLYVCLIRRQKSCWICGLFNKLLYDRWINVSAYFLVAGSIRFKENQQWSRIIPRTLQRAQFYSSHPAIYVFIDNIIKFQTTTYIKMRSIDEVTHNLD